MSMVETVTTGVTNLLAGVKRTIRQACTVAAGQGPLPIGAVVGRVLYGARSAVASACVGTGTGVLTLDATTPLLAGVQLGVYQVLCIEPGSNVGTFAVYDPGGVLVGVYNVGGAAFASQLKFAISDATDFVAGDYFTVTVTAAAGSEQVKLVDTTATDGSAVPVGILLEAVDATSGAVTTAMLTEGEVSAHALTLAEGTTVDDVRGQLQALGIVVRDAMGV